MLSAALCKIHSTKPPKTPLHAKLWLSLLGHVVSTWRPGAGRGNSNFPAYTQAPLPRFVVKVLPC